MFCLVCIVFLFIFNYIYSDDINAKKRTRTNKGDNENGWLVHTKFASKILKEQWEQLKEKLDSGEIEKVSETEIAKWVKTADLVCFNYGRDKKCPYLKLNLDYYKYNVFVFFFLL